MTQLFVASSTQGLPVAYAIQENLARDRDVEVIVWTQEVFEPSLYTLEAIERVARLFQFGIFVMTGDDLRHTSSGDDGRIPRDNVIFECGLFIGALGRHHAFVVAEDVPGLELPSDLNGLIQARYTYGSNLAAGVGSACNKIRRAINGVTANSKTRKLELTFTPIAPEPESGALPTQVKSFIHHHGRLVPAYTGDFLNGAQMEVCVLGFSLRSFMSYFDSRPEAEIRRSIVNALAHGARVRLLFLEPASDAAAIFAKDRDDRRVLDDMRRGLTRALELREELALQVPGNRLEVRVFEEVPFAHIKRVDAETQTGRMILFPYLPGPKRADTPYMEITRSTNPMLFRSYSEALDSIIQASRLVD